MLETRVPAERLKATACLTPTLMRVSFVTLKWYHCGADATHKISYWCATCSPYLQYPSSGLLLKNEFRSFEETEEDGERIYIPVKPLVRGMANFGIADQDAGNKQLNETLVMRITVPTHSQSWGVNVSPKEHSNFAEVLFHFNPRRRFVAMNNRVENIWGQQVKYFFPISCSIFFLVNAGVFHQ